MTDDKNKNAGKVQYSAADKVVEDMDRSLRGRLRNVRTTRWIRFGVVSVIFFLWVIWMGNPWLLFLWILLADIYLTCFIPWNWWKRSSNRFVRMIMNWVDAIVYALILVYFIFAFIGQNYTIPSSSLEKSLLVGDYLWVNKAIYGPRVPQTPVHFPLTQHTLPVVNTQSYLEKPQLSYHRLPGLRSVERGDIVVFNYPVNDKGRIGFKMNYVYVKRVVALPGDTISFVHSRPVNSQYEGVLGLAEAQRGLEETPDSLIPWYAMRNILVETAVLGYTIKEIPPVYVPRRGDILRMDDWRKAEIYRRAIEWETGRALAWDGERGQCLSDGRPLPYYRFRKNYYFVCGDMAYGSKDSRYWGFVPEEYIVGVVDRVVESHHPVTGRERRERRGLNLTNNE